MRVRAYCGWIPLGTIIAAAQSPALALIISLGFTDPAAVTFDSSGYLYVLEYGGTINKIDISGAPSTVNTFASSGSGDGQLRTPTDITFRGGVELVVADTGNRRLAVFSCAGSFVRNVACESFPQRVATAPDGSVYVLEYESDGLFVERFSSSYDRLGRFSVAGTCSVPSTEPRAAGALAVDATGRIWVADSLGCGEDYTLRRYDSIGNLTGSWTHLADQLPGDVLAERGYSIVLMGDIVANGTNLYVILGAGGAETGGLEVDVWSTSGIFQRRSKLVGPARPAIRAIGHGGALFVTDRIGNRTVVSVPFGNL